MAQNLVPLYIDKLSGDIVASKNPNAGNGNPNANPGFEFLQVTPITQWIISHNANTKRLLCQVYDENEIMILADEQVIFDEDTVIISFTSPQAGSAKIVFF